ncbi:Solute carrier family 22 member 13 [Nymphon striatum]|nr:Solute carrier family 22 member 13 [Nymphon striatum]
MYKYNLTSKSNETCDLDLFENSTIIKCQTFVYAENYQTLTKEWDLTCDKRSRLVIGMSIYMAGFLVGVYLFGLISDRVPKELQLMVEELRTASSKVGLEINLMSELIATRHRYVLGLHSIGCQISEFCWVALAYNLRDWKYIQITASSASLPLLLFFWIGIESPKWLISQKRYEDAKTAIKTFAKMQRKEVPESSLQIPEEEKDNNENGQKKPNPLDLFRTPKVRFRMILISIIWYQF